MTLRLPRTMVDELAEKARAQAPLEACGLLAGKGEQVFRFYPMTNTDQSAEHYSMDPGEQFAAMKDMRTHGWEIVGIWHSHPATPPRMSEEDQKLAFMPGVSYVILSLAEGHHEQIRSFRKAQDGSFPEETVVLQDEVIK